MSLTVPAEMPSLIIIEILTSDYSKSGASFSPECAHGIID